MKHTSEEFRLLNCKRLERGYSECIEAEAVPRRLGGDATDRELADDKRIARRIAHRLLVALEDWNGWNRDGGWKTDKSQSFTGSGSRLIWADWWREWKQEATELRQQADERCEQHAIDRELEGLAHVFAEMR